LVKQLSITNQKNNSRNKILNRRFRFECENALPQWNWVYVTQIALKLERGKVDSIFIESTAEQTTKVNVPS
jgi:hypothetical protein